MSALNAIDMTIAALDKIAAAIEVPYPHWLGGDDADQGQSYCRDCADKKVAVGKAKSVDGGWHQDSDGCCHCEDCGRLLDYTLTNYGVEAELDHFRGYFPTNGSVSPELAFHLSKLLETHHDQPKVLSLLPQIEAALTRVERKGEARAEAAALLDAHARLVQG